MSAPGAPAPPAGPSGAARLEELELPRGVRVFWIPLACVLLTLAFFLHGFPYDRVGDLASARLAAMTGTRISMRTLAPSFGLPPGLRAEDVDATLPGGTPLRLDVARVRPAWSLAWLRGRPAFAVDLRGPLGRADGTVVLGAEPGFDGRLEGVDLAKLPLAAWAPGAGADGKADVDANVRMTPAGARGTVRFDAREGSLSLPNVPLALPFSSLHAELGLTDAALAQIDAFALDGPLLGAKVTGSVGRAPFLFGAPLQLELRVEAKDASIRPLLTQAGLRLGPDGAAQLRVLGTVGQPLLR